ncbi:hypothetical protein [Aeromonas tecta]|uniref:hypothetical protein n=1 Tax=Aeromonas tecta TaxID=324617 RepID=UPI0012FA2564|nr:hypothetical protein [Aeromonas tecta]
MRNSISHLLSRLLNSGAAFDAPPARPDAATTRQNEPSQAKRDAAMRQHDEPETMIPAKEVNGKTE